MDNLRLSVARISRLAALVVFFAAQAAGAQQPNGAAPQMLASSQRAQFARELADEIAAFLDKIGTPDASEREAVLEELAEIDALQDTRAVNARMQRLYATPAFHHVRITNALIAVRDALACAASEKASLRREMSCWAIAGTYLEDQAQYEDGLGVLLKSGRLGYGAGMTPQLWLAQASLWARYGSTIHRSITMPFLRAAID